MRARLISTEGEYLEARIEVESAVLHVMDEFSPAARGDVLDIDLIPMLAEHESNNDILDGNPDRKRGLERIDGWSYRAFGVICSLSPFMIDCGQIRIENDDFEAKGTGIGQAVAFTISRLSARARMQATPTAPATRLPAGIDAAAAAARHNPHDCSVRAASWIAARCVRKYAERHHHVTPDLDAFCRHLEALMSADDIVEWDNQGIAQAITGLGDTLPAPLDRAPELAVLLQHAREISATQIYGEWVPAVVHHHLKSCLDIVGQDVLRDIPDSIFLHPPLHHGWGEPLTGRTRHENGPE